MKDLFDEFITTSQKCKSELSAEVVSLGGKPIEGTKTSGKFFRVWMDVKAALTGKDRKAIISSCEYGEDVAKETYIKVMEEDAEYLSAEQMAIIEAQLISLEVDHDTVKELKEMIA